MAEFSDFASEGPKAFITFFFDILETVVVAFAIFAIVYLFIASPHEVIGRSMEPNFYEGQFLLADKVSYRFKEPKRGDVIIFKFDDTHDYIKRVIGISGDSVEVRDGSVFVNGTRLSEEYLPDGLETAGGNYMTPGREEIVPEGTVFALGDNRPHSSDSRNFGMIEYEKIKGRAVFRYWPLNEMTLIPNVNYNL